MPKVYTTPRSVTVVGKKGYISARKSGKFRAPAKRKTLLGVARRAAKKIRGKKR